MSDPTTYRRPSRSCPRLVLALWLGLLAGPSSADSPCQVHQAADLYENGRLAEAVEKIGLSPFKF